MSVEITKSSRHDKIGGDFGEALILYFLSKYGFECATVDHTGIDLIARHPNVEQPWGISVKTRTRLERNPSKAVIIKKADFDKANKACKAFHCIPYFAIIVDAKDVIRAFIMPKSQLEKLITTGKTDCYWGMSPRHVEKYATDRQVISLELPVKLGRGWDSSERIQIQS